MALILDPLHAEPRRQHPQPLVNETAPASRGILDFSTVVRARGLLDAAALSAAVPATATRFDEGPLFGQATLARRAPDMGRGSAMSDKGCIGSDGRDRSAYAKADTGSSGLEALEPLMDELSDEAAAGFIEPVEGGGRMIQGIENPVPKECAAGLRLDPDRWASDAKETAQTSFQDEGTGLRARYVEQWGPIHVTARKTVAGVDLVLRVADLDDDQTEELERRLVKAAGEEAILVSAIRLNGLDRSASSKGSRHG